MCVCNLFSQEYGNNIQKRQSLWIEGKYGRNVGIPRHNVLTLSIAVCELTLQGKGAPKICRCLRSKEWWKSQGPQKLTNTHLAWKLGQVRPWPIMQTHGSGFWMKWEREDRERADGKRRREGERKREKERVEGRRREKKGEEERRKKRRRSQSWLWHDSAVQGAGLHM